MHDVERLSPLVERFVGCVESVERATEDRRGDSRRNSAATREAPEGLAVHVLHDHQELAVVGLHHVERGNDVRVMDPRGDPRLIE